MNKKRLVLLMMAAIMTACGGNPNNQNNQETPAEQAPASQQPTPSPELDGNWKADYIKGVNLIKDTQSVYIDIDLEKQSLSGNDSCNSITAPIRQQIELEQMQQAPILTLTDKEIVFGEIASTLKYCLEIEYQQAFQTALREVASYQLDKQQLHLFDKKGEKMMSFSKGIRQ